MKEKGVPMQIDIKIEKLTNWGIPCKEKFIIAGPCSAESEEQVKQTALALKKYDISVFRAGIWKPRTRPTSFEGVGKRGLVWLKAVSLETNLPIAVEVASPKQVDECLKHEIDILWIGARTTPNPFAVNDIAESLKGVDIPVMVKNPINSDLQMWIGAIERLNLAGISKLIAIHRGFSSYKRNLYRNQPLWHLPIELKRLIPDIPIICDPSHICGKSELIPEIAQKAMDLLFDGLMIEVHINPKEALSDAQQQLTPKEFGNLLKTLKFKRAFTSSQHFISHISFLRKVIDELDMQIIELLARRMEISKKIARLKKRNNISILQPNRWDKIVKSRTKEGRNKNLSEDFIFHTFQYIHEESIRQQEEVIKD